MEILISGHYIDKNRFQHQVPIIENPTVEQINLIISNFKHCDGTLRAIHLDANSELGEMKLTLYAEKNLYLFMLPEIDGEDDYYVRTLFDQNNGLTDKFTCIHGEPYGSTAITRDFNLVKKIFLEFFETGDVSRDLLS